jgi:hypothetical protein
VVNPTGTCSAPDDGARRGYHAPDPEAVWLPDCQAPLAREYWRVFAVSDTSSYVIPRPDGAPELAEPCADSEHDLHAVVEKYALCEPATSATVDIVNDIDPADALALTHYLHIELVFEVVPGGIAPFPIPSDIIDACNLHPDDNSVPFVELCEREQERLDSGHSIGFTYEGPGAAELVERLNELYEIAALSCSDRSLEVGKRVTELIDSVDRACETDEDCALVSSEMSCHHTCGGFYVASSAAEDFEAAIGDLDATACSAFTAAGCRALAPGCPPALEQEHGCVAGRCE